MDNTLRDDVKALMDKGFGDDRILRQILRACDNNEVISNFERGYVHKLVEQHLNRRPPIRKLQMPIAPQKPVTSPQALVRPTPQIVRHKSNTKIYYIIAIIAVLAVISAGAAYMLSGSSTSVPPVPATPPLPNLPIYITTDLRSYSTGDIISISGRSVETGTVMLSIKSPSEIIVWTETVTIKSTGEFATLVIATGEWPEAGQYVLFVDDGNRTSNTTFTYR